MAVPPVDDQVRSVLLTLIALVSVSACRAVPAMESARDDCDVASSTVCERAAVGPAEVLEHAPVVASLRVDTVVPTRFNTPSGEAPEIAYDPENGPDEQHDAAIEDLFAKIDEDDIEAEKRASATADAMDEAFYANWRENHPFELGHLVVLEVEEAPGVLRGPADLHWVVTFIRGGRVEVQQGMHAGCTFEYFYGCLNAYPEDGDAGLAVLSPMDMSRAEWFYGVDHCQARAGGLEQETGQRAVCMELDWLLPGSMEDGWRWRGGVDDSVLSLDRIREMIPEASLTGALGSGLTSDPSLEHPPGYADLVEAIEARDAARRDVILDAWHEHVRPLPPLERAELPLAEQRAYEVAERFLADVAARLRNPDRYLVVQRYLKIEGHGPPGSESLTYFRPHLPPGLLPIYEAGGFTDTVEGYIRFGPETSESGRPFSAEEEASFREFLSERLYIPTADAIQAQNGLVTEPIEGHHLATAALRGGAPIRIDEIAFDGHMTKARVTGPVFLAPEDIDGEGLELDTYYRLENGRWVPDDGLCFDHGGDDD